MFGYATDESPECMPVTILWAHRLNEKLRELRISGQFDWALPDSKTQVLYWQNPLGWARVLVSRTLLVSVQLGRSFADVLSALLLLNKPR